jgi:hypothetical protein
MKKKSGSGITHTPFSDAVCKPKGGLSSPAPASKNGKK